MPITYPEIDTLKEDYQQLSFIGRTLFPSALARKLINAESTPLDIFFAARNTTPTQQRFSPTLNTFKRSSRYILWSILDEQGLLNVNDESAQINFDQIATHQNVNSLVQIMLFMKTNGLLTGDLKQTNLQAIVSHAYPDAVFRILSLLQSNGFLSPDSLQLSFNNIVIHPYLLAMADSFEILHNENMLLGSEGLANVVALDQHPQDAEVIADIFVTMNQLNLLANNRTAILEHPQLGALSSAIKKLVAAGMFTSQDAQANFNVIINHPFTDEVASALVKLHNAGAFSLETTQVPREIVRLYPSQWDENFRYQYSEIQQRPNKIASGIIQLMSAGILTPENLEMYQEGCRQDHNRILEQLIVGIIQLNTLDLQDTEVLSACRRAILEHHSPEEMASAITLLKNANLLEQTYIEVVRRRGLPLRKAQAIITLHNANMLTNNTLQDYIDVLQHPYSQHVAQALALLQSANMLSGDEGAANRRAVLTYDRELSDAQASLHHSYFHDSMPRIPMATAQSLIILQTGGLLSNPSVQANREALTNDRDHQELLELLQLLQATGLLTEAWAQRNFEAVKTFSYRRELITALRNLHTAGLLEDIQGSFNAMIERPLESGLIVRRQIRALDQISQTEQAPSEQFTLKTDDFQEPIAARYIYVNPETNHVHLMMPVVGGTNIGVDNTCKSVYALQEFWGKSYQQKNNSILDELYDYQRKLEFDIDLIPVENTLKQQKKERLEQIKSYIDVVENIQKSAEIDALSLAFPVYPQPLQKIMQDSNLYSMQLRPQNMDQYIRSVDPVFSITRDDNSIFFNELQSVCQTIPNNYLNTGAKNRLVTAVLASRDGQENKFEGMQRILKEKAKEQLGIDIDFYKTSTGEPITKLFINEQMGFSDTFPASAVEYIDALIYYAAGSLFDSLAESPFNTAQSQEELSILMQFFLAEINIYCKTHHISADNLGKILDENRALSAGIAAVVKHALSRQLSVEKELCRFINTRINDFHLTKPLSTEDIKNIEENFAEHYAVIKNSPHFDEFTVFDTNQPGKFVTHQGSICTNLSEFIGEGYPEHG